MTAPRAPHVLAGAALVLVAVLGACGDDDDLDTAGTDTTSATTAPGEDYGGSAGGADEADADRASTVVAADFRFTTVPPATAGAEVTFANEDGVPHTMTADGGSFDTGTVAAGESGTLTAPTEPGDYPFHCEVHPAMQATLTVEP